MESDEGAVFEPRQIIRLEEIDDLRRRVQILEQEVQQRSTKIDSDSNEKVDLIDEVTILFGHSIWFFFVFETLIISLNVHSGVLITKDLVVLAMKEFYLITILVISLDMLGTSFRFSSAFSSFGLVATESSLNILNATMEKIPLK